MKKYTAIICLAVFVLFVSSTGMALQNDVHSRSGLPPANMMASSRTLPPITVNAQGGHSPVQTLPPIQGQVQRSESTRLQRTSAQPIRNGPEPESAAEIYSQEEQVQLPPVTRFPVPSRTTLPGLHYDTMMTVPLDESVKRVLACNLGGLTGLINTVSADVSQAGSFKMGFHSSWFNLDRVYDRQLASGESGDLMEMPIFFNYAVTDDLELAYVLPVMNKTIKSRILWNRDISESGTGDSRLAFKYRVFDNPHQMRGAFGVGFKLPTGDDSKGLGTGKTDFEIFTAFSKNFENIIAHLNLGYVMTGDPNTQFYPDGLADKFIYNFGIEYPHAHNLSVMAELNGEDWGAEGLRVEVTPGLRYTPTDSFSFQVGVPIAITNDQRFGYNYRIIAGLTSFFQ